MTASVLSAAEPLIREAEPTIADRRSIRNRSTNCKQDYHRIGVVRFMHKSQILGSSATTSTEEDKEGNADSTSI